MALICVLCTSVTNSQNVLTISAETPFCTLNTTFPFDTSPEEITSCTLLKLSLGPKTQRKYSIEKIATVFFFITEEPNNIEEKRKKQRGNKAKNREIESANIPNFSGLQVRKRRKRSQ